MRGDIYQFFAPTEREVESLRREMAQRRLRFESRIKSGEVGDHMKERRFPDVRLGHIDRCPACGEWRWNNRCRIQGCWTWMPTKERTAA